MKKTFILFFGILILIIFKVNAFDGVESYNETLIWGFETAEGWECFDDAEDPPFINTTSFTEGSASFQFNFSFDVGGGECAAPFPLFSEVNQSDIVNYSIDVLVSNYNAFSFWFRSWDCVFDLDTIENEWTSVTFGKSDSTDCSSSEINEFLLEAVDVASQGGEGNAIYLFDNFRVGFNTTDYSFFGCAPPSSGHWIIDGEECVIDELEHVDGNLQVINGGNLTIYSELDFLGLNRIISMDSGSKLVIGPGGSIHG
jgi:hypothetical protein